MQVRTVSGNLALNQIREPMFDTVKIPAAEILNGRREFFTATQGKSLHLTNLRTSGQLERGRSFKIQGICVEVMVSKAADVDAFLAYVQNTYIKLWIGEKDYITAPLYQALGRIQYDREVAGGTDVDHVLIQGGSTMAHGIVLKGADSLSIPELTNFKVEMVTADVPAATVFANEVSIRLSFKGLLRRPVQ